MSCPKAPNPFPSPAPPPIAVSSFVPRSLTTQPTTPPAKHLVSLNQPQKTSKNPKTPEFSQNSSHNTTASHQPLATSRYGRTESPPPPHKSNHLGFVCSKKEPLCRVAVYNKSNVAHALLRAVTALLPSPRSARQQRFRLTHLRNEMGTAARTKVTISDAWVWSTPFSNR